MADSHHIIDGKVVPYSGGRKCNDTDAWRDATPLELQLQEQLSEYEHATEAKDAEIEALREEIGRLLDSREREGDRLDWLLARLPGDVIRDLVGEMSCTSDVGEWRDRIDKAARFKPPNP